MTDGQGGSAEDQIESSWIWFSEILGDDGHKGGSKAACF